MLRSLLFLAIILSASTAFAQRPAIAPNWKLGLNLEDSFGIRSTDNLFNRETVIPIVRFRGWLEFDGFDNTNHFRNIQVTQYSYDNPIRSLLFPTHTQAGITNVVDTDRISIVFRIGRARDGDPPPPRLWRCLTFHYHGCPL
jgi:hypothetical protein